jgi:hypothetical protein
VRLADGFAARPADRTRHCAGGPEPTPVNTSSSARTPTCSDSSRSSCTRGGINAIGPLPADALIPMTVLKYQYVVVCYHDQGRVAFGLFTAMPA